MAHEAGKQAAGRAGASLVHDGMIVGLGTGTTAAFFIEALGERIRRDGLKLRCVATSRAAETLAARFGIHTVPLTPQTLPDLTVDGADEADPQLHLIKGGGGALVQEKIVATSSAEMVVITDSSKFVPVLGAFPVPVAIVRFGWETTRDRIAHEFGFAPSLRGGESAPFVNDDGMYILDVPFGSIPHPVELLARLRAVVGVADAGLFVGIAKRLLIGHDDGTVEEIVRA
jgi:ribose 5-phosphate isomerase A